MNFSVPFLHASEDDIESDKFDISDSMQPAKKEVVQETSLVKKYALIAAVKMIIYYGCCKKYIKQCIDYLISCVWSEQSDAR